MNRRRFQRVGVHLDAEVRSDSLCLTSRETRDLSLQGVFVATDTLLPVGSECHVTIRLRGLTDPVELKFQATVVRVAADGVALRFHSVEDLESYTHLRNLILYNSPDPDEALQEELSYRQSAPAAIYTNGTAP